MGRDSFSVTLTGSQLGLVENQWVNLEVPVVFPYAIQEISVTGPGAAADAYLDNVYFTNGNPAVVEDVSLENPDTVHVTFADDDPSGAEPVPFGDGVVPEAVVETSPNGDNALKVVKTQDVVDWAGVTVLTLGSGFCIDADHYEAMMSIYAPRRVRPCD